MDQLSRRDYGRKAMDPDRFQMKDLKRRMGQVERDLKRLTEKFDRQRLRVEAILKKFE